MYSTESLSETMSTMNSNNEHNKVNHKGTGCITGYLLYFKYQAFDLLTITPQGVEMRPGIYGQYINSTFTYIDKYVHHITIYVCT